MTKSVSEMLDDFLRKSEEYINDNPPARSGDKPVEVPWSMEGYDFIFTDYLDMHVQQVVEGREPR